MKKILSSIQSHLENHIEAYVLALLSLISLTSFIYFFQRGQILLYGDALSRLNISRKIFDNLTPGIAQLGNVWLPLPQLAMLPFVSSRYLWQSGIAGAIVSMASYVLGGFYLFKSLRLLNRSILGNLLAICVYALNINLLYLQVTAMSESMFICSISLAIYYFIKWVQSKNKMYLLPAAAAVSAMTLIRYEALAILIPSIPMVLIYTWIATKSYKKAEGSTVIYATLACLGFALWTGYLTVIFGDPLYWVNYYAGAHTVSSTSEIVSYTFHLSFFQAVWKYTTAVVWMNGLIPVLFSVIGLGLLAIKSVKEKTYYFLPILISFSIFLFMVLTLQRNTPINQPVLSITSILSNTTSSFQEFNIRYGIILLPMITLLCSYLFNIKFKILKILLGCILLIQFYSYYQPKYSVMYQLPIGVGDNITQGTPKEKRMVSWLKQNYNGGLIMISALKHDPQMLQLGVDYKSYIHEGTGQYWKDSIKEPTKYASWIVFDSYNLDDQVTKYLDNNPSLDKHFDLAYSDEGMLVYKIKPITEQ